MRIDNYIEVYNSVYNRVCATHNDNFKEKLASIIIIAACFVTFRMFVRANFRGDNYY